MMLKEERSKNPCQRRGQNKKGAPLVIYENEQLELEKEQAKLSIEQSYIKLDQINEQLDDLKKKKKN